MFQSKPFCFVFVFFLSLSLAELVEESQGPATPGEIASLEEFIPTRLTCLTLLKVSVTVSMAEFNLLHTLMPVIMGCKVSAHLILYVYYNDGALSKIKVCFIAENIKIRKQYIYIYRNCRYLAIVCWRDNLICYKNFKLC